MRSGCSLINNDLQKQRVINNLKRKDAIAHFSASLVVEPVVKNGVIYDKPRVFFQMNGFDIPANILIHALHDYTTKAIEASKDEQN